MLVWPRLNLCLGVLAVMPHMLPMMSAPSGWVSAGVVPPASTTQVPQLQSAGSMEWMQNFGADATSSEDPWPENPSDYDDSPMAPPRTAQVSMIICHCR